MTELARFKSKIEGKNADVAIYVDRLEWAQAGMLGGRKGAHVIPIKSISSVTTKKDGFTNTKVTAITTGSTIDFRVSHADAEMVKNTLTSLILGSHPAQTGALPPPPPGASLPPPPGSALPSPPSAAPSPPADGGDLPAKLAQLAELHGSGALNDDEYSAAKARLLG